MAGQNNDTHNALMDEFKRAHLRIFKNSLAEKEKDSPSQSNDKVRNS